MYRRAFAAFIACYPLFLIFSVLLTVFDQFASQDTNIVARLFGIANIAFFSHRVILTGENYGWVDSIFAPENSGKLMRFLPFIWRFSLFSIALIMFVLLVIRGLWATVADNSFVAVFLLSVSVGVILYGVALALIGTMLPAAAICQDASLKSAFRRGKLRFWKTLWQLVYGNLLFGAVLLAAYIWLENLLIRQGAYDGLVYICVSFVAIMGALITTLLAATALSIAYEETRDRL